MGCKHFFCKASLLQRDSQCWGSSESHENFLHGNSHENDQSWKYQKKPLTEPFFIIIFRKFQCQYLWLFLETEVVGSKVFSVHYRGKFSASNLLVCVGFVVGSFWEKWSVPWLCNPLSGFLLFHLEGFCLAGPKAKGFLHEIFLFPSKYSWSLCFRCAFPNKFYTHFLSFHSTVNTVGDTVNTVGRLRNDEHDKEVWWMNHEKHSK